MTPTDPSLEEYIGKRDFTRTPEPRGHRGGRSRGPISFVVQKHAAGRLHYDLRLELDGVLKSWTIPRGPSLDPGQKRLAIQVEDHPLDYAGFEGVIPPDEYGAGEVIVWDNGTYSPENEGTLFFQDRGEAQEKARAGLARGRLSLFLWGKKLVGGWDLVRTGGHDRWWLFVKKDDEFADPGQDVLEQDHSVLSGLSVEDLAGGLQQGAPGQAA